MEKILSPIYSMYNSEGDSLYDRRFRKDTIVHAPNNMRFLDDRLMQETIIPPDGNKFMAKKDRRGDPEQLGAIGSRFFENISNIPTNANVLNDRDMTQITQVSTDMNILQDRRMGNMSNSIKEHPHFNQIERNLMERNVEPEPESRHEQDLTDIFEQDTADIGSFVEPCNNFNHLFLEINKEESHTFSSYGLLSIIALLYRGTSGKVKKEIQSVLQLPNRKVLFQSLKNIHQLILGIPNYQYTSAVVVHKDLPIKSGFQKWAQVLGAVLPIAGRQSIQKINDWIYDNSDQQIVGLLPEEPMTCCLFNTCQLTTVWKYQFQCGMKKPFYYLNPQKTKILERMVKVMRLDHQTLGYYEDENYQIINLEMIHDMCLVIALGKEIYSKTPSATQLNHYMSLLQPVCLDLEIPKFKAQSKYDFLPVMHALGVKQFSQGPIELEDISEEDIIIDRIIHENILVLDGQGINPPTCHNNTKHEPHKVQINRSFNYYIKHVPTNTYVMSGIWQ